MLTVATTGHVLGRSPLATARMAGVFYLLNTLTILAAVVCLRGLIVPNDAPATASNLFAHEMRFRFGIGLEVVSTACSVAVALLLYELLKPVGTTTARAATCFRLLACAVAIVGYVFQLAPVQLLSSASSAIGLTTEQVSSLALLIYKLNRVPSDFVIVLFGFHFVLVGHLISRSKFLPRALGGIALLGGVSGLMFLASPLAHRMFAYLVGLGLMAEVSLTLWLVLWGVDEQRWIERVTEAE